tara:strand:+ start:3378 stop:3686 length:309 start_codon:yes stop_codon:yes gene_type:complete
VIAIYCLEFTHEALKGLCEICLSGLVVVTDEIAATAAEDFSDGGGDEYAWVGYEADCAVVLEEFFSGPEFAAIEWIDKEGLGRFVASDNEVSRDGDAFEVES